MTSARIVTPGQATAMTPVIMASTPSRMSEVDVDPNMTGTPFRCQNHPPGTSVFASVEPLAGTPPFRPDPAGASDDRVTVVYHNRHDARENRRNVYERVQESLLGQGGRCTHPIPAAGP